MARRNRATLKDYFRHGRRPTERAFEDLIDSNLNTLDDGFFTHSPEIGIGLAPQTENGVVISTYARAGDDHPIWDIAVGREEHDLLIRHKEGNAGGKVALTLKHADDPSGKYSKGDVFVHGQLHVRSTKGAFLSGEVPADGRWHDILNNDTVESEGCWMFQVTAGCAQRDKGRYALLHALAMHCFGSQRKISKTRSHFGIFGNRLAIRWLPIKGTFKCRLQLKTLFRYDEDKVITYHITSLWDNPSMVKPTTL